MSDDGTGRFDVQIDDALIAAALASVEEGPDLSLDDEPMELVLEEPGQPEGVDDELEFDLDLGLEPGASQAAEGEPEGAGGFDPGAWGEPPPSEVEEARESARRSRALVLKAREELEATRAERDEAAAKVQEARERYMRLRVRHKRMSEGHEKTLKDLSALRTRQREQDQLLQQARQEFQQLEKDRDRTRRRHQRELDESRLFATEGAFKELLPVIDNLDLAMSHADGDPERTVEGIRMIVAQLESTLKRQGLSRVPCEQGVAFDPNVHEALSYVPHDTVPAGRLVETLSAGYVLNGRLVRAARVVVASGPTRHDAPVERADEASPAELGSAEE